jgi:hypothetical protein
MHELDGRLVMALDFVAVRVPIAKLNAGEVDKLLAEDAMVLLPYLRSR